MLHWSERLKQLMIDKGWSARELATRSGISHDSVRKYLGGNVDHPRGDTPQKLADALGISVSYLLFGQSQETLPDTRPDRAPQAPSQPVSPTEWPKNIPVLGTAAGSTEGAFQFTNEEIEYVRRPPQLEGKSVYALYIQNDSMEPRYFAGEVVFVDAKRPPGPGDFVIIEMQVNGETAAMCKRLVRRTSRAVIVAQYNPAGEIEVDPAKVVAIHRIIPWEEVHGF